MNRDSTKYEPKFTCPYLLMLIRKKLVGNDASDGNAKLYLRPQDRACKPIHSTNVKTRNVVLEITVPKRTGGKRKKGSTEPYQYVQMDPDGSEAVTPNTNRTDTRYLMRSLQDNDTNFGVQAVGLVEHTHRFRSKFLMFPD